MNANFGSQGQHRSVVLSLKLAEIELMETVTKEKPILLLDDVMSELDNNRQLNLLESISQNIQTFITTTTLEHLQNMPSDIKIFLNSRRKFNKKTCKVYVIKIYNDVNLVNYKSSTSYSAELL